MSKIKLNRATRSNAITYGLVIAAYLILTVLKSTGSLTSSLSGQLVPICAYIVMAVSLNLTIGIMDFSSQPPVESGHIKMDSSHRRSPLN